MGKLITTDLCLFDLDGTIINTTEAVEKTWRNLCSKHGVDPDQLFHYSHGSRTSEVLNKFFPNIDNTDNKFGIEFERMISLPQNFPLVKVIPGAIELLNSLPPNRWCIVTSGGKRLAYGWFDSVLSDIKKPKVFITAETVQNGKPNPEGYLKGANELQKDLNLTECEKIVFEDAPTGIKAGVNSGATVIGIASGFEPSVLYQAGASFVVKDLSHVKLVSSGSNITLEIDPVD